MTECARVDHYRKGTKAEALVLAGQRGGRGNLKVSPARIQLTCSQRMVDIIRAMHEQGHGLLAISNVASRADIGPVAVQHIIKGNAVGVP